MDEDIRKTFMAVLDKSLLGSLGMETSVDADQPPITADQVLEMIGAILKKLNTIYDLKRGDLPGKLIVSLTVPHKGIVERIIKRGESVWIKVSLEDDEFELVDPLEVVIVDVPKPDFRPELKIYNPLPDEDRLLWAYRLRLR